MQAGSASGDGHFRWELSTCVHARHNGTACRWEKLCNLAEVAGEKANSWSVFVMLLRGVLVTFHMYGILKALDTSFIIII